MPWPAMLRRRAGWDAVEAHRGTLQTPLMTTDSHADLVLRGGRIATMDAARSWASALAVRDGRIVAVGPDERSRACIGPRTRVIDLRGRTVTPGFQDAHVHPVHGGLAMLRCDLHSDAESGQGFDVIEAYARSHPDETWIRGGGWYMAAFEGGTPRREDLDRIVPDRPAYLTSRDGHSVWVNTKALELAGVTASTPDPSDGRIERDPDGTPSGTLHEGAMDLVARLAARRHAAPNSRRLSASASGTCMASGSPPGRTRSSRRTWRSARTWPWRPAAS